MLKHSFRYPLDNNVREFAVTTILVLLSITIIPAVLLLGYIMEILSESANGNQELPEYPKFKQLAIQGLRGTGVILGYFTVPILLFATAAILIDPQISEGATPGTIDMIASILGLISFLLYTIVHYLIPIGLIRAADTESIKAAFDYSLVWEVVKSTQYLIGMITAFLTIQFFGGVLAVVLILLTGSMGAILAPVLYAYAILQGGYLIGSGYNRSMVV